MPSCTQCGKEFPAFPEDSYLKQIYGNGIAVSVPPPPWEKPLAVTDDTLARAKQIIAGSPVRAAGYRLKVLLIERDKGLEAGEAAQFPTLAAKGIQTKSDNQKAREDRGSDDALIVDVGPAAWCQKQAYGSEPWAKVGMVIKMIRYTGHAYEEPPGSGKRYALINDEDVLGYYEEAVNG